MLVFLTHQQPLNLPILFKAIKALHGLAHVCQGIHKVRVSDPLFRVRVEELIRYVLVPLCLVRE
jgi:hypothetical protein